MTSDRGLLNTFLHESAHHLDVWLVSWSDTPHTRGFYWRVDALYPCPGRARRQAQAVGLDPDRHAPAHRLITTTTGR